MNFAVSNNFLLLKLILNDHQRGLFNRSSAIVPTNVLPNLPNGAQGALNISHPSTFRSILGYASLVQYYFFVFETEYHSYPVSYDHRGVPFCCNVLFIFHLQHFTADAFPRIRSIRASRSSFVGCCTPRS